MKTEILKALKDAELDIDIWDMEFEFEGDQYSTMKHEFYVESESYNIHLSVDVTVRFDDFREFDYYDHQIANLLIVGRDEEWRNPHFITDEELLNTLNI